MDRAHRRGGATVEFALLNIILVPLLLYAIFLMDAAYLKVDLQETVVSGVWDFSTRNTEPPSWSAGVSATNTKDTNDQNELASAQGGVRVVYADHTSAFDDGADPTQSYYGNSNALRGNGPDGVSHMKHHTGFGAQYTFRWQNGPDTQFQCTLSPDMGWNPDPDMKAFASSGYNTGGEVRCEATGFIYNYIIPQQFMQEFSQVDLTAMKRRRNTTAAGVHEWQGEGGNVANIVAYEVASVSFNTWALRNGAKNEDNINPGSYDGALADADVRVPQSGMPTPQSESSPEANPFFRRVQYLYTSNGAFTGTYGAVAAAAGQFTARAASNELMAVQTFPPATVSNNMLPNIVGVHLTARYKPGSPGQRQPKPGLFGGGSGGFLSTPYSGPDDDYQRAASNRGPYYLGCKTAEAPTCN